MDGRWLQAPNRSWSRPRPFRQEPKSAFKPDTFIMPDRSAQGHVAAAEIEISQTGWVGLTPCG
ncbi:MAG: hypothetical protein ACI8TF_002151 [Paracoccaceae bacterium]|jgi:hypothetical protein